ncbi:pseudouridine synthase [Ereboglobus luteus]|uniref:Pseudouridine synthase n=1 Tax=Ereboglobus luteus TaxID=1796921 RepID=A0A2U8E2X1_9BACT|nr:pseudouridine synthase [Ereboglobus luteus]AWI09171.1 RNA-binding protein [Ereboglobus luteus]
MSDATETIRIQKYIADAGVCSRRAAETLIREGEVWVNGACATIGQRITPGVDKVTVSGSTIRVAAAPRITLAVHKPRGLICSNYDPHDADTIFTVLPRDFSKHRFFCAGRLDKDSEGLVILTTDGDLAHRLMHPSNVVVKHYLVLLKKPFPSAKKNLLTKGIVYEGERLKVERVRFLAPNSAGDSAQLDVQMHHGKKREIRLLFSTLGFDVKRLKRYQIGAFSLKGIPVRAVKPLTPREIEKLFKIPSPVVEKSKKTPLKNRSSRSKKQ